MAAEGIIQRRLRALDDIDANIVKVLEGLSGICDSCIDPSEKEPHDLGNTKDRLSNDVRGFYTCLSNIAISLRKEVRIMDENMGTLQNNADMVMILPVNVERKNTTIGLDKLDLELSSL